MSWWKWKAFGSVALFGWSMKELELSALGKPMFLKLFEKPSDM